MRKVGGSGLGWVGIPLTCCRLQGAAGAERALLGSGRFWLGSGRLLALWKANSQLAYHRHRPTRGKHKQNSRKPWPT